MFLRTVFISLLITSSSWALSLTGIFNRDAPFPTQVKLNEARERQGTRRECSPHTLRQILKAKGFTEVQKLFSACDRFMTGRSKVSLALQYALGKTGLEKPERYQNISFRLSTGETLKGVLALKESRTPLPLVILRTGIYGKADFATTNSSTLLAYFENSPFHVLLLENPSNEDYVERNGTIRIGGLSGGRQILEVTRQVRSSRYRKKFSEYHLAGFSLGAHDSLYANVYSTYDSSVRFKSVTALCPAVELAPSIRSIFSGAILGASNSSYLKDVIERQWGRVPALQMLLTNPSSADFDRLTIRDIWVDAASAQLTLDGDKFPPPINARVNNAADFLKFSSFANYSDHVQTPTYIIQAEDDSVTPYAVNLKEYKLVLSARRNPNVHTLTTKHGEHCAFAQVYGLDILTSLLSGIIQKHSSSSYPYALIDAANELQRPQSSLLNLNRWPSNDSIVADYRVVKLKPGKASRELMAEIRFRFFSPSEYSYSDRSGKTACHRYHYWNAPLDCMADFTVDIPAHKIGLRATPGTQEAKAAITRFNVTAAILDTSKEEILGTNRLPKFIYLPKFMLDDGYY